MSDKNDTSVEFLCKTRFGKIILESMFFLRVPKILGAFLRSPISHFYIKPFIKKNGIDMTDFSEYAESGLGGSKKFRSFNDFFTRKKQISFDKEESHLISPSDSLLSAFKIDENSRFKVKGFDYALSDFFGTDSLDKKFLGGDCLIFRLCATDYHRYSYIDSGRHDGENGKNHFLEGKLYSVQPVALESFRVFTKNRRSWTILSTKNFGDVAQIEVGAFSVGGIVNHKSSGEFEKGEEKGFFDLHGSTIVLLFEPNKIELLQEIKDATKDGAEFRVKCGQYIGNKK